MRSVTPLTIGLLLFAVSTVAQSGKKSCDDLKSEIAAKLDAKGVKNCTLDVVIADQVKDQRVVGTCEAGSKRIVYKRN